MNETEFEECDAAVGESGSGASNRAGGGGAVTDRSGLYLVAALVGTALLVFAVDQGGWPRGWLRASVMWPGLAALVFAAASDQKTRRSFWRRFQIAPTAWPWVALSVGLFPLLAMASVLLVGLATGNDWHLRGWPGLERVVIVMILALGEEVGWRGYALPGLAARLGWLPATAIVGLAWAVWHLPGAMVGFGAPSHPSFLYFGAWVVAASFVFSWFHLRAGGTVWVAVALHAGANLGLQVVPVMPVHGGDTTPFFVLLGLTAVAAGAVGWSLRRPTGIPVPSEESVS